MVAKLWRNYGRNDGDIRGRDKYDFLQNDLRNYFKMLATIIRKIVTLLQQNCGGGRGARAPVESRTGRAIEKERGE